jgi:hypothetical protein
MARPEDLTDERWALIEPLDQFSIECEEGKIHRRDAERSAEGTQRKTFFFSAALCGSLCVCGGEFRCVPDTQLKTALIPLKNEQYGKHQTGDC